MNILNRRRLTIAIAVVGVLGVGTFAITLRTTSQQLHPSSSTGTATKLQPDEKSPELALRVFENADSPLRILNAKVQEISAAAFTKLTGQKTSLDTVCSVPEVQLLNSSGKPITGFVLVVRDPASKTSRGIVESSVSIGQGETYTAQRQAFVRPEWTASKGTDGQITSRYAQRDMNSDKFWLSFARRSDLIVTIARVNFQDGSTWTVKEGGEVH
jgi:hypothetical protein